MMRTVRLASPSIRGAGHECVQDILPSAGASVAGRGAGAGPARQTYRLARRCHAGGDAHGLVGGLLDWAWPGDARGLTARHAVKQVDRMLSNPGIDVDQILALWVPFVIGARSSLLVAMDWTDFDADNQAT